MINLCSSSDEAGSISGDDGCLTILSDFSPIKPKTAQTRDSSYRDMETNNCDPKDAIKSTIPSVIDDDYHDEAQLLPILSRTLEGLTILQLFTLMIGAVPGDRICRKKPTAITYSSVFVIDLLSVHCIDNLRADDNGAWVHGGKPRRTYHVELSRNGQEIEGVTEKSAMDKNQFTLVRLYHRHKGTPEFQRRISYVIDSGGKIVQFAVLQYLFENRTEVPVVIPPDGNAKKDLSRYQRTQRSILSTIKEMPGKPKLVVSALYDEVGGMLGASSCHRIDIKCTITMV